jgi:hypothetical protein
MIVIITKGRTHMPCSQKYCGGVISNGLVISFSHFPGRMEEAWVRPPSALVAFPASSSSWGTFPSSSRLVRDVRQLRLLFRREDGPRLVTRDSG